MWFFRIACWILAAVATASELLSIVTSFDAGSLLPSLSDPSILVRPAIKWISPQASASLPSISTHAPSPGSRAAIARYDLPAALPTTVPDFGQLLYIVGDWASSPIRLELPTPFELMVGATAIGLFLFMTAIFWNYGPGTGINALYPFITGWMPKIVYAALLQMVRTMDHLLRTMILCLVFFEFWQEWRQHKHNPFAMVMALPPRFWSYIGMLLVRAAFNPFTEEREAAISCALHLLGTVAQRITSYVQLVRNRHATQIASIYERMSTWGIAALDASVGVLAHIYVFIIETAIPFLYRSFTWALTRGIPFLCESFIYFYLHVWPMIRYYISKLIPSRFIRYIQLYFHSTWDAEDYTRARLAANLSLGQTKILLDYEALYHNKSLATPLQIIELGKRAQSYRMSLIVAVHLINHHRRIIDAIANYQYCMDKRIEMAAALLPFSSAPYGYDFAPGSNGLHLAIDEGYNASLPISSAYIKTNQRTAHAPYHWIYEPKPAMLSPGCLDIFAKDENVNFNPLQALFPGIVVPLPSPEHNVFEPKVWRPILPPERQRWFEEQVEDLAANGEILSWDWKTQRRRRCADECADEIVMGHISQGGDQDGAEWLVGFSEGLRPDPRQSLADGLQAAHKDLPHCFQ